MIAKVKSEPLARTAGVSGRAVILALGGRFTDEILSGLPDVLMPTLRTQLGLSYTQVALLRLALDYVAAIVEPVAALLIDVWQRRWLLAWGAAGVGLATMLIGVAPTFLLLALGFAVYGLGSGPLAHTADVVLVEAHPQAPGRIFARATMLDTLGALLAPLLVALTFWLDLGWRGLLVTLGAGSLVYAVLLLRTNFPPPHGHEDGQSALTAMRENLRTVLRDRTALTWLLFLFTFDLLELPLTLQTVWLHEEAGMSQALVGVYRALALGISLFSLLALDRWLSGVHYRRVLQAANVGLLLLIPLWLLLPGVWTRFLLGVPLNFLFSFYWPIGRGQSLASVPGRAGAITAVASIVGLVPLPLLFGLLAEAIGLTEATLWVSVAALLGLVIMVRLLPD